MTPFVCLHFELREQKINSLCFSKILLNILLVFGVEVRHAEREKFMKIRNQSNRSTQSNQIINFITRISYFVVVDHMLCIFSKNRKKFFEFHRINNLRIFNYMNNRMDYIEFIVDKISKSAILQYFGNGLFLTVVQKYHIGTRSIFICHILHFYYFLVDLKKTLTNHISHHFVWNSILLQFLRDEFSWQYSRNYDVVCYQLLPLLDEKWQNLKILIFELSIFVVKEIKCVVLLLGRNVLFYVFMEFVKDNIEILKFGYTLEKRNVKHPLSEFTLPTAIRQRKSLESHLIPQFLHIPEHLLISIQFNPASRPMRGHSKHKSSKSSNSTSISLSKEESAPSRKFRFMLLGKSLVARRHIKQISVIVSCDKNSWHFLLQIVFNQLNNNPHFYFFLLSQLYFFYYGL